VASTGDGLTTKGITVALLTTIVGGTLVWFLTTQPGSPFTHPHPIIIDFSPTTPAAVADRARATFRVENTGNDVGVDCKGFWTVDVRPGQPGAHFYVIEIDSFGLAEKEVRSGSLTGREYPAEGDYQMALDVACSHGDSTTVTRTVSVVTP
jgi:hypothetical protein